MKYLTPEILEKVLESDVTAGQEQAVPEFSGLSIDSRKTIAGDIFFAIKGEKEDGHDFVHDAFKRGAVAAVISREQLDRFASGKPGLIFAVSDPHEALLNLAAFIRRRSDAHFAAITGSNGKTTTKEMLYSIVAGKNKTYRSPGNLNNLFGLPISLGKMPVVDYAIFELGISIPGEMLRLAQVIKPELAIITNIGPAHLETLKTIENVIKAKFELIDRLPVGAIVVLNADDKYLMAEAKGRRLNYIGFSINNPSQFQAQDIKISAADISFKVQSTLVRLPLQGRINVYNALAAIAASSVWECGPAEWVSGLANFKPVEMRLELVAHDGLHLIIDCYNANPDSTMAALNVLKDVRVSGRRIAVLGDMLELGEASPKLHFEAGRQAVGVDYLFCFGPKAEAIAAGAIDSGMSKENVCHFREHQKLLEKLLTVIKRGDAVLFKGSRGMELEKVVVGVRGTAFKDN